MLIRKISVTLKDALIKHVKLSYPGIPLFTAFKPILINF